MRLIDEHIGKGKRYEDVITLNGKELNTLFLIDGAMSPEDYVKTIETSIFLLCAEGFSPWSPRLYESISFGAIPLILAESIVLPFERFIDWRSFSMKININNVDHMIDMIRNISQFEQYVKEKLVNATRYFRAFRWPYSSVHNDKYDRHLYLSEEDSNEMNRSVFHFLSRELRCRRLEQFYGLNSDRFSEQSKNAKQQTCREHSIVCPCYDEEKVLALTEYI